MSFKEKLSRFFYGRYGTDQFNNFLIILALILSVFNIFLKNYIIYIVQTIFIVTAFVRMLSRNIYKRRNENQIFLKIRKPVRAWIILQIDRVRDKNHVYRKCTGCKAVIRLPKKKGKHKVTCPKCKTKFDVRI